MNTVVVMGRLGQNAELRYTPAGQAILNFNIAVNEAWGKGEQRQEKTHWFSVSAFGEWVTKYQGSMVKGAEVVVYGRLAQRTFTRKDGGDQSVVEIVAQEFRPTAARDGASVPQAQPNVGGYDQGYKF